MLTQFSSAEEAAIASAKDITERFKRGFVVFPVLDGEIVRQHYLSEGGAKNGMRRMVRNLCGYCGHNSVNPNELYEKLIASKRLTFLTVQPTLP